MPSKQYQQTKAATPSEAVDLPTALAFLKDHSRSTFDETVELHVHLTIDPSKSDQAVRGDATLPAGTAKQQRVVVFTEDASQQQAATAAGATQAGGEELVAEIAQQGALDADVTVATPSLMPKIASIAKILGPKGLMPNPKTGTVTPDPLKALQELQSGKVSFKMDQLGNIHSAVGKASWEADRIAQNTTAMLDAIRAARPAAAKGQLIGSVTIKTTMSPAIRLKVE